MEDPRSSGVGENLLVARILFNTIPMLLILLTWVECIYHLSDITLLERSMAMIKKILKNSFSVVGFELCRFDKTEKEYAERFGWDLELLSYKDFQVARSIGSSGLMTIDEARFLSELVKRTSEDESIIEIGTLFGFSTLIIIINKAKSQELITVDNYSWNNFHISSYAHKISTEKRLRDASTNHNVKILCEEKDKFYENYEGSSPGLFFCDADHDYEPTLRDLLWARKMGARIICGHDYKPEFPGVIQAVKEMGGPRELVDSLYVV